MAVGGAFLLERRRLSGGHIFQPFGRFSRSAGPNIDRDVRLGADLVDEVHEFMRSERVRFDNAAPIGIEGHGSLIGRADAVAPVVFVGEAAAGPANVRHFYCLERCHHVVADAARIGNRRNPDQPRRLHKFRGQDAPQTGRKYCGRSLRRAFDTSTDSAMFSAAMSDAVRAIKTSATISSSVPLRHDAVRLRSSECHIWVTVYRKVERRICGRH